MTEKTTRRISLDLGEALDQAVTDAARKLGLSKAETMRRAASYLGQAMRDEDKGYCVGSWKEVEGQLTEKKLYLIR